MPFEIESQLMNTVCGLEIRAMVKVQQLGKCALNMLPSVLFNTTYFTIMVVSEFTQNRDQNSKFT